MMRYATLGTVWLAALALSGCSAGPDGFTLNSAIRSLWGDSPQEEVAQAFNVDDPDQRREGIVALCRHEWGRKEPYLKAYGVLTEDPEPSVRSAAVTALGRGGDTAYLPHVLKRLNDPVERVRLDAAVALNGLRGEDAVAPLCKSAIEDGSPDVRAACVGALRHYPMQEVAKVLVGRLRDDSFAVRHAARQSLTAMMGEDYGYDPEAWQLQLAARGDSLAPPREGSRPWWDWLGVTERGH